MNRRKFVLITAFVLALLVVDAFVCRLDRQTIWPKTQANYIFLRDIYQAQANLSAGDCDDAILELNEALPLNPNSIYFLQKLADLFNKSGEYSKAINCSRDCLKLQPDSVVLLNNLAWLLVACPDASIRNGPEAVRLAERACFLSNYRMPHIVGTLGAAYAEAGDFSEAILMAKRAQELAATENDPNLLTGEGDLGNVNQQLEEWYSEHKAYGQFVDLHNQGNYPYISLFFYTRHEMFMRETNKENVKLLFIGDSITDYWRNRGSNVWNHYYAPLHVANFGIGGDGTPGVLWRVKNGELVNLKPKVIVLLIGTNQTGTESPVDIANDIEALVKEIRARCPESKVLLLAIFPRNHPGDNLDQIEGIQVINKTIASMDDGNMIRFLNIDNRFLGPDGKVSAALMPDGLHPGEKGYQVWAEAMQPTLADMLNLPSNNAPLTRP